MRSPVRIRVAAPDNPEEKSSGLWLFIGHLRYSCGSTFLFRGCLGVLPYTLKRALCRRRRFGPHTPRRCVKLACKQQEWVSSARNTRAAPDILAAARSRSRENNTLLFSNTLAPLRYPEEKSSGLWLFIGHLRYSCGSAFFILGLSGGATLYFEAGSVP